MKKIIILLSAILLIISATSCNKSSDIVGNNDEEILNYLKKSDFLDSIDKENISIVDTINIDESKIVGFSSDTRQGYFVFEKNKKDDYIMTYNMAKGIDPNSVGVSSFIASYNTMDSFDNRKRAFIVISNGSTVSNVEMKVNNYVFNEKMEIGNSSMIVLTDVLSESEASEMGSFSCRYFDVNNEELK